jgi:hypothetical protein
MFDLREELERLSEKCLDPRKERRELLEIEERERVAGAPAYAGVMADNKDPECQRKLRVACEVMGPETVTG